MPAVSAPGTRERLRPGQGRGGVHPPEYGGGGDGARGDGAPDYDRRLYRAKLALLLIIGSICVLFLTVTVALMWWESSVAIDAHNRGIAHAWMQVALPTRLLLWNTLILLLSSITVEMARRSIAREMVLAPIQAIAGIARDRGLQAPWLAMTVVLGGSFICGQCLAWNELRSHGFHLSTIGMSPVFYLLSGAHAVHVSVGIMILLYATISSVLHRQIEHRRIVAEVGAWYWHFMGALWLCIFVLLYYGY
jgi:cytochrome c oxidase subunit III